MTTPPPQDSSNARTLWAYESQAQRYRDQTGGLGRRVRRTDATVAFVAGLREAGHEADILNVLTDALVDHEHGPHAAVLANAVFLHFALDELHHTLVAVGAALAPGGLLGFSVKAGHGSGWSTHKLGLPRFFQYWQPGPLRAAIAAAGLRIIDLRMVASDPRGWIYVIATPDSATAGDAGTG